MTKLLKISAAMLVLVSLFWLGGLMADKEQLQNNLIRLHVVADSDSPEDQGIKLQVRDAIIQYLQPGLTQVSDVQGAQDYITSQLPALERLANRVLRDAGCPDSAQVTLAKEAFDTRQYDTFSLPAGVYRSLRVEIGEGQGRNWWCVVFPSLCLPATTEDFQDSAVSAGFDSGLTDTLAGDGHEIRFFFLDCLGEVENFFFAG